jgi:uncharacterized membrane protein
MPEEHIDDTQPERRGILRRLFVRGLAVLLPTIVTILIIVAAFQFLERNLIGPINSLINYILNETTDFEKAFNPELYPKDAIRYVIINPLYWVVTYGLGLVVTIIVIYIVGLAVGTWIGRRIWAHIESRIIRFPVVRSIYPSIKQVTGIVFSKKAFHFRSVVALEYPRKEVWSIGFVTSEGIAKLNERTGRKMVTVFIPSSPAPMTGYVIFVDEQELVPLDMTVGDALRLMISGGLVTPSTEPGEDETTEQKQLPAQP